MTLGKIAGFDSVTGRGFITPDHNGKKVFIHADDLEGQRDVHVGIPVRFSIIPALGLRAYNVRILSPLTSVIGRNAQDHGPPKHHVGEPLNQSV
jgi:cold shock CspA family protein